MCRPIFLFVLLLLVALPVRGGGAECDRQCMFSRRGFRLERALLY
ncbi:MAG: hypothetical protein OXI62_01255 [Chloroflexota bacterium]|nr:hypothetical protein [Chloroflexota bacterium]MDE2649331.1 hypothetical protein [Chloroflexota bacterium]